MVAITGLTSEDRSLRLAPPSALLGILCLLIGWIVELQAWSLVSRFVRTAAVSTLIIKSLESIAEPVLVLNERMNEYLPKLL